MLLPPTIKTIRDLAKAKLAVDVVCRRCRHRQLLFPMSLAERVGADFPVAELPRRLRCTGCQARGWVAIHPSVRD
jgi:hypothetical protein